MVPAVFPFTVSRQHAASWKPHVRSWLLLTTLCGGAWSAPVAKPRPVVPAAGTVPAKPAATSPAVTGAAGEYILGPEDVLGVTVSNHPDLNSTVTIRPDGKITLARAGEVMASGKTATALAQEIETKLARTLNHAHVQVTVNAAHPRQARILGAVKTPGAYAIRAGSRVVDLVAQAGGLSTKASRITARVIRAGNVISFNIETAVSQPGSSANVRLKADDVVDLEAQNFVKQITVAGSVAHPGTFDLDEDLTVVGLLAQAGGATSDADLQHVSVLRNGKPIPLDISGDNTNPGRPAALFRFRPGDVLVVPENQARYGIMGQVNRPGYYVLPESDGGSTVLKALAQAGGAMADGDLSGITLTRSAGGATIVLAVNADAMMQGTAPDNIALKPDDVLFIPKRDAQVHVIGPVTNPGAYELEPGMTLVSLLAKAGSPTSNSGLGKAYILRNGQQIAVDLRALLIEGKTDAQLAGFQLQRGDVLVIPDLRLQVQVNGQVVKPGAYDLSDNLTLVSLLALAGNPMPDAALSQAYVLRGGAKMPLDLRALLSGKATPEVLNFKFQPGDSLVVPQNPLQYAVVGQVGHAGTFIYPEGGGITVLQALNNAGGPGGSGGANLSQASIVRTTNGQQSLIPINLDALFKKGDMTNNIKLQPQDVLYIPPRKGGPTGLASILSLVPAIGIFAGL